MTNWLLPEYIQDTLPDEAWAIENMRAKFLTLLRGAGYQLVAPPMVEYAESLLLQSSHDMDLRSFKLVDQCSGRTLAVRADITPQVARIDAHLLNRQGVTRLCYAGSVLHALPAGLTSSRELLQIGAELYGHAGMASDLEVQQLLLQALTLLGVSEVHLDVGHVAVFRALVSRAGLQDGMENILFNALQRKDVAALQEITASFAPDLRDAILALVTLYGNSAEVLERARRVLPDYPEVRQALHDLQTAWDVLQPQVASLGIDLADLRGYHYHSGFVFAAYHAGSHDAIALGGRYDGVGQSFGRARAATGFSMDLRQIYRLLPKQNMPLGIAAPNLNDAALLAKITTLRAAGEMVVIDLLGEAALRKELQCDRELVLRDATWQVVAL